VRITHPGAEFKSTAVEVKRARPQTAHAVPKKNEKEAARWRAENDFTFYTPSDDPKEIAMHEHFQERQSERLKKHQREVEMRSALTGWAVRRARIDEEIVRRQEAVNWSVRAHSTVPRVRVLDVNADPEEEDGILSDESDTEFADGVLSMEDAKNVSRAESAGGARAGSAAGSAKKSRPQSRGATWLSSYHEKSFHRIEYQKPKVEVKRPQSHRPMYVQRPESAATDVGGRPGSAYLHKPGQPGYRGVKAGEEPTSPDGEEETEPRLQTPRIISATSKEEIPMQMSSLPTRPRAMSATQYRKELNEKNKAKGGKEGDLSQPEGQPTLLQSLKPEPAADWEKDQMDFRRYQVKEVQDVREAFMRQGQRVSMATIERAIRVPNERTFAECMSGLTRSGYMLRSDPSMKKKKKGKKKKKK